MDDHQCFTAIQQGTPQARRAAVDCLYQRYAAEFFKYLQRHRVVPQDAQDILHDTFLRLLEPLPSPIPHPKPYLYRMLINRAKEFWAQEAMAAHRKVPIDSWIEQVDSSPLPLTQATVQSAGEAFAAFARDHPDPGIALELTLLEGWNMKELAQFLGKNEGATREYISCWRKKFRQDYLRLD